MVRGKIRRKDLLFFGGSVSRQPRTCVSALAEDFLLKRQWRTDRDLKIGSSCQFGEVSEMQLHRCRKSERRRMALTCQYF